LSFGGPHGKKKEAVSFPQTQYEDCTRRHKGKATDQVKSGRLQSNEDNKRAKERKKKNHTQSGL
jgi:hypothetical protein